MRTTLLETNVPQVGRPVPTNLSSRLIQMTVKGDGVVSATAYIEATNDRIKWFKVCLDITVSGTATLEEALGDTWPEFNAAWAYMRAVVTDIQGPGAYAILSLAIV